MTPLATLATLATLAISQERHTQTTAQCTIASSLTELKKAARWSDIKLLKGTILEMTSTSILIDWFVNLSKKYQESSKRFKHNTLAITLSQVQERMFLMTYISTTTNNMHYLTSTIAFYNMMCCMKMLLCLNLASLSVKSPGASTDNISIMIAGNQRTAVLDMMSEISGIIKAINCTNEIIALQSSPPTTPTNTQKHTINELLGMCSEQLIKVVAHYGWMVRIAFVKCTNIKGNMSDIKSHYYDVITLAAEAKCKCSQSSHTSKHKSLINDALVHITNNQLPSPILA